MRFYIVALDGLFCVFGKNDKLISAHKTRKDALNAIEKYKGGFCNECGF